MERHSSCKTCSGVEDTLFSPIEVILQLAGLDVDKCKECAFNYRCPKYIQEKEKGE